MVPTGPHRRLGWFPQHDGEERYQPRCRPGAGRAGPQCRGSFRNHDSIRYPYGGHAAYTLNVDTGKLGLWPGGFLKIFGESQFGSYLQGKQTGALLPPNAAALYPMPFDDTTTLTSVVFTQFLAKWFGIYLGKLDTFGGDMNAFAHEWKTQFMNTGFGPSPLFFNIYLFDVGSRIDRAPNRVGAVHIHRRARGDRE